MIKRIPLPMAGVMLGTAALGNLLQSYSETLRLILGAISAIIGVFLIVKIIMHPNTFKEEMKNPIMASVFGTFTMALMLLAVYAKPFLGSSAVYLWYLAIILHTALIIYFTAKFIIKLDIPKVFASYFIVYVGIAVASVSAPAFKQEVIGAWCFWFAFITLIITFALVTYRYIKHRELPEPARPLFCIYTAPVSLCLAGYIQSVMPKSAVMITSLAIVATIIYFIVLFNLPKFLKLKFYPSYSAFTFPFVISAIATKQTMGYFANAGTPIAWLEYLVIFETIVATILVCYSLIRYCMAIIKSN